MMGQDSNVLKSVMRQWSQQDGTWWLQNVLYFGLLKNHMKKNSLRTSFGLKIGVSQWQVVAANPNQTEQRKTKLQRNLACEIRTKGVGVEPADGVLV